MPRRSSKTQRNRSRLNRKRRCVEFINSEKNNPCVDCGGLFPPECMDFDHIKDKLFGIATKKTISIDRIKTEIAKCELVCANCHRIRTKTRAILYKNHQKQTLINSMQDYNA